MIQIGAPSRCSPRLPYQIFKRLDLGVNLAITPDFDSFLFFTWITMVKNIYEFFPDPLCLIQMGPSVCRWKINSPFPTTRSQPLGPNPASVYK
jgi:hypothetical protein